VHAVKISILQPEIERGNIQKNVAIIQRLINTADGDLLILAEYALTGSLVLDENANIQKWATESELAKQELSVPENKKLLINSLIIKDKRIYNACTLLPGDEVMQIKTIPDKTETNAGICAGSGHCIVQFNGKKIIIVICSDFVGIDKISTSGADMLLYIYHFTRKLSKEIG
jgi:predicted amidohydrolase